MLHHEGLTIYTDGSSRGNPGRGGYGAILIWRGKKKEISGGFRHTTNNRMELMSVIAALETLTREGLDIVVYSDSQYVVKAVQEGWLKNWIRTDFKGGKKNRDLWTKFHQLSQKHTIKFVWVKGHHTNPYNNRCDELATAAADGGHLLKDEEYEKENGRS
jgi:ribonuclease HI